MGAKTSSATAKFGVPNSAGAIARLRQANNREWIVVRNLTFADIENLPDGAVKTLLLALPRNKLAVGKRLLYKVSIKYLPLIIIVAALCQLWMRRTEAGFGREDTDQRRKSQRHSDLKTGRAPGDTFCS